MFTIIAAGGDAKRMGRDKASLPYKGTTMALYLAKKYEELGPVAFAVDKKGKFDTGDYPVYEDAEISDGPMNALSSAFANTDEEFVFIASLDMPYVEPALIKRLLEMVGRKDACVIEKANGEVEGFCGVYHQECEFFVNDVIRIGINTFQRLLFQINVRYVKPAELPEFDIEHMTKRILTPEDYEAIKND